MDPDTICAFILEWSALKRQLNNTCNPENRMRIMSRMNQISNIMFEQGYPKYVNGF